MQNKQLTITYGYYFYSEAIISFLIILPIINTFYQWKPYLLYLALAIVITVLFSLIHMRTKRYAIFMIAGVGILVLFSLCGFPFALSFLFTVLLTWRYIHIQNKKDIERDRLYVKLILLLSIFHILVYAENIVLIFPFLQLLLGIAVQMIGNLITIEKRDRKRIDFRIWIYILLTFVIGAGGLLFVSNYIKTAFQTIWRILSSIIAFILSLPLYLLEFLNFDYHTDYEPPENQKIKEERMNEQQPAMDSSIIENNVDFFYWIIAILAFIAVTLLIVRHFKKKLPDRPEYVSHHNITYEHLLDKQKNRKGVFFSKRYFHAPNHPIRKLVHQFEKRAAKSGKERKPFETLEEWLTRIGFTTYLNTYQKVRYGNETVTEIEKRQLKNQLKKMSAQIENDNKPK